MSKAGEKNGKISGSEHRYNIAILKAYKLIFKQERISNLFYGCTIEDASGKVLFADKLFAVEIPDWLCSKLKFISDNQNDPKVNKIIYRQLITGKLSDYLSAELSSKLAREIIKFGEEHKLLKGE